MDISHNGGYNYWDPTGSVLGMVPFKIFIYDL